MISADVVIIGGGPTGLGAGYRLKEISHPSWLLLEEAENVGGLSSTVIDDQGFSWDLGVHSIFSHYDYYDRLMAAAIPEEGWISHTRAAFVWMRERFVAYPLQNNLWQLPEEDVLKCIDGLLDIHNKPFDTKPTNFREWIDQKFGAGLADIFMVPYNRKVWATEAERMCTEWMGERVATVNLKKVLSDLIHRRAETAWGPNALFKYPVHGGSGSIWTNVANLLPSDNIRLKSKVVRVSTKSKQLLLSDGTTVRYKHLISTMPLDLFLQCVDDQPSLTARAPQLRYSAVHLCCFGIEGELPERLKGKYWMYFPENNTPTFRVTVFSNYSPYNVPRPGEQWSLLCEVSESVEKPVNAETVMDEVIQGLINVDFLTSDARIVSRWHRRLNHGYPTPFLGRDQLVHGLDSELKELDILTRGRFGGWKYEVSNQDHACMQGVEAVDFVVEGKKELTFYNPDLVNGTRTR